MKRLRDMTEKQREKVIKETRERLLAKAASNQLSQRQKAFKIPNALKPLAVKDPTKAKEDRYSVFDIESCKWEKFIVGGIYDGEMFEHFPTMKECLIHLFSLGYHHPVYAHFGGGFDFLFVLEEAFSSHDFWVENIIPRGDGRVLLQFDLHHKDYAHKLTFVDSFAFLPFGLARLCQDFDTPHKKLEIEYKEITEITPEVVQYLHNDCRALYEVIEIFKNNEVIKSVGLRHTTASQSTAVLRTFLKDPVEPLFYYRKKRDNESEANYQESLLTDDWFVRGNREKGELPAYLGGRTEVFRPEYASSEQKLGYYDFNSLYPSVMLMNEFPMRRLYYTDKFEPKKLGFWEVTVQVPTVDQDDRFWIPPLGIVYDSGYSQKYIFPTGIFRGKWCTAELNHALSIGVKILKVHRGAVYSSAGNIFKEFISFLYEKRITSKNKVDNFIYKLLMNSSYGRQGLNPLRDQLAFFDWSEGQQPLDMFFKNPEGDLIQLARTPELVNTYSNVSIAAYVTAYGRIKLHQKMLEQRNAVWYCDTDSLFTPNKLPTSSALGELKLESEHDEAVFILPKTYGLKGEVDGKTIKKIVAKGLDNKKIQNLDPFDLLENLKGHMFLEKLVHECANKDVIESYRETIREISSLVADDDGGGTGLKGMTRALREDHRFVSRDDPRLRRIKSLYDKRKLVYNANGTITTEPWVLNGVPDANKLCNN